MSENVSLTIEQADAIKKRVLAGDDSLTAEELMSLAENISTLDLGHLTDVMGKQNIGLPAHWICLKGLQKFMDSAPMRPGGQRSTIY